MTSPAALNDCPENLAASSSQRLIPPPLPTRPYQPKNDYWLKSSTSELDLQQPDSHIDSVRGTNPGTWSHLSPALPSSGRRLAELAAVRVSESDSDTPRLDLGVGSSSRAIDQFVPTQTLRPLPAISKDQYNMLHQLGSNEPTILDLEPLEIARQLTIRKMKLFCSILPEELLSSQWMRNEGSHAPNIKEMARFSNSIDNLVFQTILQHTDINKSAAFIEQWIKIAHYCLELHNYDGHMDIVCSLGRSITRRRKTWGVLPRNSRQLLRQMQEIVDPAENSKVRRARLGKLRPPCLPFLGMYLADLRLIDADNPSKKQESLSGSDTFNVNGINIINFDKHTGTAKIVGEIQRFQKPYDLTEVTEIQDWLSAEIRRCDGAIDTMAAANGSSEEVNKVEVAANFNRGVYNSVDEDSGIGSGLSTASVQSSISSPADLVSLATPEWARLLLNDEGLGRLYPIAISKVGPSRFPRNLARFLKNYSRNLEAEASNEVQIRAVHFARHSANRAAVEVTKALMSDHDAATKWKFALDLTLLGQIDQWLELQDTVGKNDDANCMAEAEHDDERLPGNMQTSPEHADDDEPRFQNFEEVKEFMISAGAFTTLRQELQSWLKVGEMEVEVEEAEYSSEGNSIDGLERAIDMARMEELAEPSEAVIHSGQSEERTTITIHMTPHEISISTDITSITPKILSFTMSQSSIRISIVVPGRWLSVLWLRLEASLSPPMDGYERLFYTCSCGDLTYFDVREISAGGIERIKQRLRVSAVLTGDFQHHQSISSDGILPLPTPVHTRPGNSADAGLYQSVLSAAAWPSSTEAHGDAQNGSTTALIQNTDPQFLLLCIAVKDSAILAHVEVGSLTNDEFLFREIRKVYNKATEDHAWNLSMMLPKRLRNVLSNASHSFSRMVVASPFSSIRLHRVASGDFVRVHISLYEVLAKANNYIKFHLVPIRDTARPAWFKCPEFPPESEVAARRYLYEPVPIGVDIVNIPLAHLLKPGEHHSRFWLSMLPKKLSEELHRPAGCNQPVIGWGIRVNERLNWSVALIGLLFMLVLISIVVIIYSAATSDNSAAFGLGAYLVTLLTVYVT